jgi:hypothetical protein
VVLGFGESITQIDSAVLFASDRGIMLLSGSDAQCISDGLDNLVEHSISDTPIGETILTLAGLTDKETFIVPFKTFLQECQMIYDYFNQHIIVFNPNYGYAYIYSLKSKLWGMIKSDFVATVNSYPDALAMTAGGNLVDVSSSKAASVRGVVVTRPLKLDAPDVLKTVSAIIQRGVFARGHVQQVLQGSRDCITWLNVWSSTDQYLRGFRGTPYKYFRMVLICDLKKGESISGASIQFEHRYTNNLR